MERSFPARLAIGRLSLPSGPRLPRAPGLGHARAALAVLWRRRATRIALIAALVSPPLLGGGYVALRHSSFVAVQRVHISGVRGAEAPAIAAALESAARHMSTLDVHAGALRAAVAQFPVVRGVRATAQFPHGLSITVVEQPAVAALVAGGVRTAVAADGVVLPRFRRSATGSRRLRKPTSTTAACSPHCGCSARRRTGSPCASSAPTRARRV
jgi:cell division protein FtsQ